MTPNRFDGGRASATAFVAASNEAARIGVRKFLIASFSSGTAVPVTVKNYIRAQSDIYFAQIVKTCAFAAGTEVVPSI